MEVRDPFAFSNAQKKSVSLGCPARFTGILPAKLRVKVKVTFGSVLSSTRKSECAVSVLSTKKTIKLLHRTILPFGAEISARLSWIYSRKGALRGSIWLRKHRQSQRKQNPSDRGERHRHRGECDPTQEWFLVRSLKYTFLKNHKMKRNH